MLSQLVVHNFTDNTNIYTKIIRHQNYFTQQAFLQDIKESRSLNYFTQHAAK